MAMGLVIVGLVCLTLAMVDFNYPLKNFLGGWDENGWIKRNQLNVAAIKEIKSSPWVGVGAGNFLVRLPDFQKNNQIFWLQPVHNIFLLVLTEIGILGLLGWGWILGNWLMKKKLEWKWILILGVVGISGLADHYWLTLPQNMWLITIVLGMI